MTALYGRADSSVNTLIRVTDDAERGGAALKRAVHAAREEAGITTDTELALKAHVHYDTLMNWFSGRTTPRPAELKKIADVIGVRYVELLDVWEGRESQPPRLEEALHELIAELRISNYEQRLSRIALEEATSSIVRALGVAARPARDRPGTPQRNAAGSGGGNDRA